MSEQEAITKVLNKHRAQLLDSIDLRDSLLGDTMVEKGIITADDLRPYRELPHRREQNRGLLSFMEKRPWDDFKKFKAAMVKTGYDHLVKDWPDDPPEDSPDTRGPITQPADEPGHGNRGPANSEADQPRLEKEASVAGPSSSGTGNKRKTSEEDHQKAKRPRESQPPTRENREIVYTPASPESVFTVRRKLEKIKWEDKDSHLTYSTKEQYQELLTKEKCYPMTHETRGRGLVVTMTGNREGWEEDVLSIAKMFRYLDVMAEYKFDLKEEDLRIELERFAGDPENNFVDCMFVVLMGHGGVQNNVELFCTADGQAFPIRKSLQHIFKSDVHRHLVDKPKIFLIQACRGETMDPGIRMKTVYDETQCDASKPDGERVVSNFSDYIISFASQPGAVASRDTKKGSWYIQELTKTVMQQAHSRQLTCMLSEVNKKLEKRSTSTEVPQLAESVHGLKAPLYLFPGVNASTFND